MRKACLILAFLFLLPSCGGDDEPERCRWVRFVPEQGESYYEYVCDGRSSDVRRIPE